MKISTIAHDEAMICSFMEDPEFAEAYLKEVQVDGNVAEIHRVRSWVEEAENRRQDAIMA